MEGQGGNTTAQTLQSMPNLVHFLETNYALRTMEDIMSDELRIKFFGNDNVVSPGAVSGIDQLMQGIHRSLSPIITKYNPTPAPTPGAISAQPATIFNGGNLMTMRRYRILVDKIMIPYKGDDRGPGRDGYLSGYATEADLLAAGCNVDYLVKFGHIEDAGFVAV